MYIGNSKVPDHLGVVDGRLAPLPDSPNAVSSQTDNPEKRVEPLPILGDKVNSMEKIKQAILAYGGSTIVNEREEYIHVVFSTPRMKYKDDVEFYIDEANQVIHIRSASRVGHSDLGLNRKRYEELKGLYMQ
ncbi:hypothetical protein BHU72_13415 [Desulfuribacillus stibiiarsenatis]|uniref:DUF1499 domain-containing protein n=2 Tax=Desulfuribacillus stibiiarsenatis TaxID=1390249 RepID=A0A1E5L8L5_9FIRM|nr:hypothetical protein BHU72_13415 [Desulfuribacillus stibiiarsenatis]